MTNPLSHANALRHMREENERLKSDLDHMRRQTDAYRSFVRGLNELQAARSTAQSESDLIAFLDKALTNAIASVHATDGSLLMVDSDTQDLVFMQVAGSVSATLPGYRIRAGEGVAGWVVSHGAAQIVNEPYSDTRFAQRVDAVFQFKTRNFVAVPIRGKEGVLGVLETLNKRDGRQFDHHDLDILTVVADLLAGAITRVDIATRVRLL